MALDRLIEGIKRTHNPTVAGLDPKLEYIPDFLVEKAFAAHGETLEGAAAAILAYNKGLIDALCDIVPAVKPQHDGGVRRGPSRKNEGGRSGNRRFWRRRADGERLPWRRRDPAPAGDLPPE